MDFKKLAAERFSCRKMTDRPVNEQAIEQIIETALLAPTAVNRQPFKIFLMNSEQAKENISKVTPFTFGAQTFLVVGYQESEGWTRKFDQMNFAGVDASIAATHIMLEITDLGLATTWVGYFNEPLLKSFYPEMDDYKLIALFPIGYAAEEGVPSAKHYVRKSRKDVVEIL